MFPDLENQSQADKQDLSTKSNNSGDTGDKLDIMIEEDDKSNADA
jgi:hypothetical protein